jgi:osmotically-inducible protein OsmY
MPSTLRFTYKHPLAGVVLSLVLSSGVSAVAQGTQPDNSAQNKGQTATADNQSNAKSDRLLAQQVRKAIMADKGLSTYAHNVKIIAQNGTVTLKGPVQSDDEKQKVAADAASVVDSGKVANQLTVKQ